VSYCTAEEVKEFTGYKESDFSLMDSGAFEELIEKWIKQADAIINADRGRTFDPDEDDAAYAELLRNISMRIVANYMTKAIQLRTSPVERIDDFTVRVVDSGVVTQSIRDDMQRLPRAINFAIAISNRLTEEAEA